MDAPSRWWFVTQCGFCHALVPPSEHYALSWQRRRQGLMDRIAGQLRRLIVDAILMQHWLKHLHQ